MCGSKRPHQRPAISFTVLLIFIAGCGPIGQDAEPERVAACRSALPPVVSETRGLIVQPDDGREPILDELEAARCTIDLTIYLITDDFTIEALRAAVARGVRVRVILEEHPFGGAGDQPETATKLQAAGVSLRWGRIASASPTPSTSSSTARRRSSSTRICPSPRSSATASSAS